MPAVRLLPLTVLALAVAACGSRPGPPNVVVVTVESLRTDHVGAYGGHSPPKPDVPVTPNLDAFAREAVVYDDAQAVTSWTLTSHASLFTGLYPTAHQTIRPRDRLDDSYVTFAEVLRDRGYQTAGIASGPYLRRAHNLNQGFELYDDDVAALSVADSHADVTNPRVEAALERFLGEQRDPKRPFLLFVYLWDPHYDYLPPPPYDRMFVGPECEPFDVHDYETRDDIAAGMPAGRIAYVLSQYDGEIRTTDELLGRFFASLERRGLWDDTAVLVTADHGEEFFDHGEKGHKKNLYAETVHVPLLVKYPRGTPHGRDGRLVSHVDVFPTVLALAGAPVPDGLPGRSLLEPPAAGDRVVLYELLEAWYSLAPGGPVAHGNVWSGVRRGTQKLAWKKADGSDASMRQLFDVARDPTEQHDLAAGDPAAADALAQLFTEQIV
ncbi:MAG TPA: sulfatase, partial [Pseudonocardia sp.]|nr:sulfatase [Pseudonocardia sp.]